MGIIDLVRGATAFLLLDLLPSSLEETFTRTLQVFTMRFGVVWLGVAATLGGVVQAQCPDYTTFSQVRRGTLTERKDGVLTGRGSTESSGR